MWVLDQSVRDWLPPRDSNPDMLIQSQLSCNLPLLLICPDYAICASILKGIGANICTGSAQDNQENRGKIAETSFKCYRFCYRWAVDVWLTYDPSVNSHALRRRSCYYRLL